MDRFTEEMKLWLFDLAHGNLDEESIIKGFIKHYVLHDCVIRDVQDDIVFHTSYGVERTRMAITSLEGAMVNFSK